MSVTIGVDPGLSGAIAIVDSYGVLIEVHDMPVLNKNVSVQLLHDLIDIADIELDLDLTASTCVIEDVHSMPKQGVASSFKFGRSKGVVEGYFAGRLCPLRYVSPSVWKRDMRLGKDKSAARERAVELWPSKAGLFRRVKDDGRAEAALIALWWLEHGDRINGGAA